MKKWFCIILMCMLSLCLTACKNTSNTALQTHFLLILENKQAFYSADEEKDITLSDYNKNVWQYACVDMNNDNRDELAIMFEDGNILILKNNGTSTTGFQFGLNSMYQINKDGSFLWNDNAGNTYGCSTLKFKENQYETVELWRVENNGAGLTAYYINNKLVPKSDFNALSEKRNEKGIEWTLWQP